MKGNLPQGSVVSKKTKAAKIASGELLKSLVVVSFIQVRTDIRSLRF